MAGETIRRSFTKPGTPRGAPRGTSAKKWSAAAEANWPGMRTFKGSVPENRHRMAA